ncbi:NYN domain-containing protein [Methylocystis sp. JAN1]|uniref:NYN domain-containing protein n=1 Tax=Methylocystis sp. JAN1 TaxID=3397211 RepID=UPI003FA1D4AE
MDRVAIFVDAGYLFAQGSAALSGSKVARSGLSFDAAKSVERLKLLAEQKAHGCRLLRIYWYDGALAGSGLTTDQATLAHLDDVKLRLGAINNTGQQKGVDSLIVTDLIELARLKSISDALLLSGDEDVRIGVQIAQNYGVRVHLLGIQPSRGSQSSQLLREADTTTEWEAAEVSLFLSLREVIPTPLSQPVPISESLATEAGPVDLSSTAIEAKSLIEDAVQVFVENLDFSDIEGIKQFWETEKGVPSDLDRKLLPTCGAALGRKLERHEITEMRTHFSRLVRGRIS